MFVLMEGCWKVWCSKADHLTDKVSLMLKTMVVLAKEAPQAGSHLPAKMSQRRNSSGFSPDLS